MAAAERVLIYADGGSRGNPGPAGYGAVVFAADGRTVLAQRSEFLGRVTNNVAEYSGLIAGLRAAAELGATTVAVRMDSKLVVEQMSGRWQVKHPDMKPLARTAMGLVRGFERVTFEWIPRARNSHADRLANAAMDAGTARPARVRAEPAADADDGLFAAGPDRPDTDRPDTDSPDTDSPDTDSPDTDSPNTDSPNTDRQPRPATGSDLDVTTTVVVIRHGETSWGAVGRYAGREDVELTDRGREQAAAVADRVAPLRPDVVLSSPLRRCRDTAAVISAGGLDGPPRLDGPLGPDRPLGPAEPLGPDVQLRDELSDGMLGEWTGYTAQQIGKRWPELFAAWRSDADARPPGGESFTEIRTRVTRLLTDVLAEHAGRVVVLVTHSATTKMLLAQALDVPSEVAYRLRIDNASFSVFTVDGAGATTVLTVNETGHLPLPRARQPLR